MVGLTLFTPVRRRWLPLSKPIMHLGRWVRPAQRNVLQFQFIHAVRWTFVRKLPYNGPPQERERIFQAYEQTEEGRQAGGAGREPEGQL